ncbi:Werner helicase interacting protein 1 [Desmophyllum pertusum]|uniref:Werner helicase interacting protein 1 n=1 Tax=Desmophyllum pertusum TaxID=174260 RepID=A0A9X0CMN2_9CNID|nr:Werner helicase interacting protein 1 [Desmophyllum pertusum]
MSQDSRIDCPICGSSFAASLVNEHVNKCLNTSQPPMSTSAGKLPGDVSSANKSPTATGNASLTVKSSGFFSKRKATSEKALLVGSPKTSALNMLKRSYSNLAGKSTTDHPLKKLKLHEATNDSKSPENQKTDYNAGTNEPVGCQSSNAHFPAKKIKDSRKAQKSKASQFTPLAERMRPKTLAEYVGQSQVLGSNSLLRTLLEADEIPSMILWGPPGCGKTTLAHIIANSARISNKARFVQLSATTSGINDIKEVVKVAKNEQQMFKRKTILFVDEIHRFNKLQQDTFLPHVENGTITLIGATTENPSFQLNNALLSRCRVIVLEKLTVDHVEQILQNALDTMGVVVGKGIPWRKSRNTVPHLRTEEAITTLANLCDGDARIALNGLQLAIQSQVAAVKQKTKRNANELNGSSPLQQNGEYYHKEKEADAEQHDEKQIVYINVSHIKQGLQKTHLLYDRNGEEHYNIISALHKSIRGSDENAALYWLARMLVGGEDPLFVARRLVRCASEDIGLADPQALNQAVAAYQACHFIGMPECDVILAQAAVYLARAPSPLIYI